MNTEHLRDLANRAEFRKLLEACNEIDMKRASAKRRFEVSLLKAQALFELHRVDESKKVLCDLEPQESDLFDEDYLYAKARVAYLDENFDEALRVFALIHEFGTEERHRFRGLLGMANVLFSLGRVKEVPALIEEMHKFEPLERDDDRLSLLIFLGSFNTAVKNPGLAKAYLRMALSTAANRHWSYFIHRSLYGLACIYEKEKDELRLRATLEILRSFVNESESVFFAHIVNRKFLEHQFSIETHLEFDQANCRVFIQDRWISFKDRPEVYRFLEVLHNQGTNDFVSTDAIAGQLLPEQSHSPVILKDRIHDLARQARATIETYGNQPVVLLSGERGFKLACD